MRALALSDLSRFEEALYEICLAVGMDKSASLSNTELFQHDLTKASKHSYCTKSLLWLLVSLTYYEKEIQVELIRNCFLVRETKTKTISMQ